MFRASISNVPSAVFGKPILRDIGVASQHISQRKCGNRPREGHKAARNAFVKQLSNERSGYTHAVRTPCLSDTKLSHALVAVVPL
jgi:hypothetical protein